MRFASLFTTLAIVATSFVAAVPVSGPNDAASIQSVSDTLSSDNSQLGPWSDKLGSLTQSSNIDPDEVKSAAADTAIIVEKVGGDFFLLNDGVMDNSVFTESNVRESVQWLEKISQSAEKLLALLINREACDELRRLIGKVNEATNNLSDVTNAKLKSDPSSN